LPWSGGVYLFLAEKRQVACGQLILFWAVWESIKIFLPAGLRTPRLRLNGSPDRESFCSPKRMTLLSSDFFGPVDLIRGSRPRHHAYSVGPFIDKLARSYA
jgi:hypothetical protein